MPVTVAFTAPRKPRLSVAAQTLKAFCQQTQYTHAAAGDPQLGFIQLYTTTSCERCGCRLMGANSINVHATLTVAAEAGLTVDVAAPEEGGYCETFDQVTCTACYAD